MTHSFPRIIWQTHNYKQDELPKVISETGATWKNLNPEWDYRYVDHIQRSQMIMKYPEVYKVYKNQTPVYQSDIWRSIVTYNYGGCYADMDSVCVKPLEYLLQEIDPFVEMITVPIYEGGKGNNHNYITKKKSKPMAKVFNEIIENPEGLVEWATWEIFVKNVYSDDTVLKSFIVQTEDNSWQDQAARHMQDYKTSFEPSEHRVNDYGKMIDYLDFIKQNNLKPSY